LDEFLLVRLTDRNQRPNSIEQLSGPECRIAADFPELIKRDWLKSRLLPRAAGLAGGRRCLPTAHERKLRQGEAAKGSSDFGPSAFTRRPPGRSN
jgi:hypothetical protein